MEELVSPDNSIIVNNDKAVLRKESQRAFVREKIKDLYFVRRWPIIDIMRELRIDTKSFQRYVDELKNDFRNKIKSSLHDEVANSVYHSNRNVLAECWYIVESAKSDYVKLKALELINNIEMNNVTVLQSVGLLEKPTEKHEVTHKMEFNEMMEKWRKMRSEEVIDAEIVNDSVNEKSVSDGEIQDGENIKF